MTSHNPTPFLNHLEKQSFIHPTLFIIEDNCSRFFFFLNDQTTIIPTCYLFRLIQFSLEIRIWLLPIMVFNTLCVLLMCTLRYRENHSLSLFYFFYFIKKLWMTPLKRITCSNSIEVFEKLLNSINSQPEKIQTDMESLKVKCSVQTNC